MNKLNYNLNHGHMPLESLMLSYGGMKWNACDGLELTFI